MLWVQWSLIEDAPVVDTSPCFPRSEVASLAACSHLNRAEFVALHPAFTGISREAVLRTTDLASDAVAKEVWSRIRDSICRVMVLNCTRACNLEMCGLDLGEFHSVIQELELLQENRRTLLIDDLADMLEMLLCQCFTMRTI